MTPCTTLLCPECDAVTASTCATGGRPSWRLRLRSLCAALPLGCGLAFAVACTPSPPPGPTQTVTPLVVAIEPRPSPPPTDDRARLASALLAEWESAQNAHDHERYAALYGDPFVGTLKRADGATRTLDRDAWIAARKRLFGPKLQVASDDVKVVLDAKADRVTISFVQRFRTDRYADHGRKEMILQQQSDGLRIIAERMLESRLGWDEADQQRRFPAHGATCYVSFDPSNQKYLVALGHFDAYRDALHAAGKARSKDVPVEIVVGDDFSGLEAGYWLLSGASDDEAEAKTIATRTQGKVWKVRAAPGSFPSVLRPLGERLVNSAPALISSIGNLVYLVSKQEVLALTLSGDELVESFRAPLPAGLNPIRVAVRDGQAYVLAESGHWSLLAARGVVRTPAFDPEPNGQVAIFGPHHFEVEGESLVYRRHNGEAQRAPLASPETGIWRLGDDRMLLLRRSSVDNNSTLFLFAVGQTPRSLTKVCGAVTGELEGPAHVAVGGIDLDTDRAGGFELWSSQWGFYAPLLTATPQCPVDDEQGAEPQTSMTPEVGLFGQQQVELEGETGCECDGC